MPIALLLKATSCYLSEARPPSAFPSLPAPTSEGGCRAGTLVFPLHVPVLLWHPFKVSQAEILKVAQAEICLDSCLSHAAVQHASSRKGAVHLFP